MRTWYLLGLVVLVLALGALEIAASHAVPPAASGADTYWDEPAGIVLRAR